MEDIHVRAPEGDFLGEIEPVVPGVWRWPFTRMAVGDWFTVADEVRPIGQVRQYAYMEGKRLRKKFSVTDDGDKAIVKRVSAEQRDERSAAQIAAERAVLVGGDGDRYLGVLVPPDRGQWSWPFGKMEPGQYFHVSHDDRHPEKVRQLAMVRASQLAIKLTVRVRDPEKPHHTRVEYVDVAEDQYERTLDWAATNAILKRCYGTEFNDLPQVWKLDVQPWKSMEFEMPRLAAPRIDSFLADFGYVKFVVQLKEDRVIVTGMPIDGTYNQWLEREALA